MTIRQNECACEGNEEHVEGDSDDDDEDPQVQPKIHALTIVGNDKEDALVIYHILTTLRTPKFNSWFRAVSSITLACQEENNEQ